MLADDDFVRTLDELGRLLNDPDVPADAAGGYLAARRRGITAGFAGRQYIVAAVDASRMRLCRLRIHGAGLGSRLQVRRRVSHPFGQLFDEERHAIGLRDNPLEQGTGLRRRPVFKTLLIPRRSDDDRRPSTRAGMVRIGPFLPALERRRAANAPKAVRQPASTERGIPDYGPIGQRSDSDT